jgi:hypothetical protein
MPRGVFVLWWIGVVLTFLVFIPLAVVLLHRLWRTARDIQLYARETLTAAQGIAGNTANIVALDTTIGVEGEMLPVAANVATKLDTIASVVEDRAG